MESADTCTTMTDDLEDGELSSSDEEVCDIDNKETCSSSRNDKSRSRSSSGDAESAVEPVKQVDDSVNDRKRPFQSPEPDQCEDVPSKRSKSNDDHDSSATNLEDGEIYSDDEEAMYYPSKMVKSRLPQSGSKSTPSSSSTKSLSPPRRRWSRSRSRSHSPIPRERFGSNRSSYNRSTYNRRPTSPNKGKDHNFHRGGSGWRGHQRDSGRPRGGMRPIHGYTDFSGRHSNKSFGANERWVGDDVQLTLETIESRLKRNLSILPTPTHTNPCYSLDEFNYPAPPQWYFKAVTAYNRKMGFRPKSGRGSTMTEGGEDMGGDNLGVQLMDNPPEPPYPPSYQRQPLGPPPTQLPVPDNIPSAMGIGPPPAMGMGPPPAMGMGPLPAMGMGPPPIPGVRPPEMGSGLPNMGVMGMGPNPIMGIGPPPSIDTRPEPVVAPPTTSPVTTESSQPPDVPAIPVNAPVPVNVPVPVVPVVPADTVDDDATSMSGGDLVIDKDQDEGGPVPPTSIYQDISPPSSVSDLTSESLYKPSVNVSTEYTKSLGKRGGRKSVMGHGSTRSRGSRQSMKKLIVCIDLTKVNVGSSQVTDDEIDDYDDYLNQLNNEEEDEEEEEEVRPHPPELTSIDSSLFWIDTNAQSMSSSKDSINSNGSSTDHKEEFSNPLDEEFPVIGSGIETGKDSGTGTSLQPGDGNKKGKQEESKSHKSKSLKRAEKSYWMKNDKIEKQQEKQQQLPNFTIKKQQQQDPTGKQLALPTEPSKGLLTQKLPQPCKYYLQGYCIHGDNCQYDHSIQREKKREMCKFYLQDICDKGDDCVFYHGDFPCKYFHGRHMCYHGEKCKFSHAPLTEDGYQLLMGVLEPNLWDQVTYPGQAVAGNPSNVTPSPHVNLAGSMGPGIIPDPNAPPPSAPFPPIAPANQQNMNPVPAPAGMPYPQSQSLDPQPHSQSIPPQIQSDPPNVHNISCNVKLPKSFNIESLFPDEHPQVLPHDLATQLREVLLDTPSATTRDEDKKKQEEEEEKYELYYWENDEKGPASSRPPVSYPPSVPSDPPPTLNQGPQPLSSTAGDVSMLRPPIEPHPHSLPTHYTVAPDSVPPPRGRRLSPDPRRERDPRHDPVYDRHSLTRDITTPPLQAHSQARVDSYPTSHSDPYSGPPPPKADPYSGPPPPRADPYSGPPPPRADPYSGPPPRADPYSGPPPPRTDPYSGPPPPRTDPYFRSPPRADSYSGPNVPRVDSYSGHHSNVPLRVDPYSESIGPPRADSYSDSNNPPRVDPYSGPHSNVPSSRTDHYPGSHSDPYSGHHSNVLPHSLVPPKADSYSGHFNGPPSRGESYRSPHSNVSPRADTYSGPQSNNPDPHSGPNFNAAPPHSNTRSGPYSITHPSKPDSYSSPRSDFDNQSKTDSYSSSHSNIPPHSNFHPPRTDPYSGPHSNIPPPRTDSYSGGLPPRSDSQSSNPSTSGYTIPRASHSKSPPPVTNKTPSNEVNSSDHKQQSSRLTDPRKKYSQFKVKSKSSQSEASDGSRNPSEPLPKLLRDSSVLDKPIAPQDLFNNTPGTEGISIFGSRSQPNEGTHEYGEIKLRRDSLAASDDKTTNEDSGREVGGIPSYMTGISHDEEDDDSLHIDSAFGSLQNRKRRLSELTAINNRPLE